MIIYMYLFILIVSSIITGIIVTIIEKKALVPDVSLLKEERVEKEKKNKVKKQKKEKKKENVSVFKESPAILSIENEYTLNDMFRDYGKSSVIEIEEDTLSNIKEEEIPVIYHQQASLPLKDEREYTLDDMMVDLEEMISNHNIKLDDKKEYYENPVLVSSYTINLEDVVQTIHEMDHTSNSIDSQPAEEII